MFEAEAGIFQKAGIQVGADLSQAEERLLSEALSVFSVSLRNQALEMARLYSVLFCFENSVRDLIRDTLQEKFKDKWWDDGVSEGIRKFCLTRQETALKDTWLEGSKDDPLSFADFSALSQIIVNKWELFEDIIPTQHWLKQRMDELEKARSFIAHNRMLLPSEFQRIYMYIADWNRVVGL